MATINTSTTPLGQISLEVGGRGIVVMYVKESIQGDIVTVLTAVDSLAGRVLPITTLQRLLDEWRAFNADGEGKTITFKVIFNHVIKSLENEHARSGLELTRGELERTRGVMENNIEQVVERSERIGLLVDKTDRLQVLSNGFRGTAVKVKRSMWWQNIKFWAIVAIIIIALLLIVLKVVF